MNRINEIINYIHGIEISNIIDLIIAISIIIMFLVLSPSISYIILRIFYKKENKDEIQKSPIYKTIRIFINILGIYLATKTLSLAKEQDAFFDKCMRVVIIWTVANVIAGVLEQNQRIVEKMQNKKNQEFTRNDRFTVIIISKIVKFLLYILATYATLKEFDYDISGLATGLGIGGAIIALAAQNLVKQLLSGFAIVTDKPFVIGDSIDVVQGANKVSGKVVGITWRSTKLQTPQDTTITIDNSVIITSNVVNWGKIKKRVYDTNIHLALETEEQTIEKIINRIKFILKNDQKIITESIRVMLETIDTDYLTISIHLDTQVTDYNEYKELCNKINLIILNILETQGVSLSYPGRNVYIKESKKNINSKKIVQNLSENPEKEKGKKSKPVKIKKK